MTDDAEKRRAYFAEIESVWSYRSSGFEYEKLGVQYSTNALKILTYLNGGALVALPAAVALFQINVSQTKYLLVFAAFSFIAGLLAICLSHTLAFVCMSKRSEAEHHNFSVEAIIVRSSYYPEEFTASEAKTISQEHQKILEKKFAISNVYRTAWLACLWLSVGLFIIGCYAGSKLILRG